MSINLTRNKRTPAWMKLGYFIRRCLPFSQKRKLALFLDLEWLFWRFAQETSFAFFKDKEHPFRAKAIEYVLPLISKEMNVLDLGCGKGILTNAISQKANYTVGVDYSDENITYAKNTYTSDKMKFVKGDALDYLKESDEKFDVLILSHILEHLDEPKAFIEMFKDFFDYIYIELPDFERDYINEYRKILNSELIYSDADHITEFDRDDLLSMLKHNGVVPIRSEYRYGIQRHWCKVEKNTVLA